MGPNDKQLDANELEAISGGNANIVKGDDGKWNLTFDKEEEAQYVKSLIDRMIKLKDLQFPHRIPGHITPRRYPFPGGEKPWMPPRFQPAIMKKQEKPIDISPQNNEKPEENK